MTDSGALASRHNLRRRQDGVKATVNKWPDKLNQCRL